MRTSKPVDVTFEPQQISVEQRQESDEALREKVKASMTDPRPSVPADDVFKRLRMRHSP